MEFEWSFPTRVVFGKGRFRSVPKLVRGFGKKVFVITSRSFAHPGERCSLLSELAARFENDGTEIEVFSEVEPNPRVTTVDKAIKLAREFKPRFVLALGGGSVMDAGKCVALMASNANPGDTIMDYVYQGPGRAGASFHHTLPLVCVPTVAATGSEASIYAVVTDRERHRKLTIFGNALRPALSVVDPELTYTVSARQSVDGAFDILTHVLETYFSAPEPLPMQDRLSEAIAMTVVHAIRRVLDNPRDDRARSELSWCSTAALSGFLSGRDGGWPVHALEHGLSAWTDVGHGRGLAFILPRILAFDSAVVPERVIQLNRILFGVASTDALQALELGLYRFMREVGALSPLTEIAGGADIHIDPPDLIEKVVDHALEIDGIWKTGQDPFLNNCRPITRDAAVEILRLQI